MHDITEACCGFLDQELIGWRYSSCCFCSSCWDSALQKSL